MRCERPPAGGLADGFGTACARGSGRDMLAPLEGRLAMATEDRLRSTAVRVGCARLAGLAAATFLAMPVGSAQAETQALGEPSGALPGLVRVGAAFPLDPGLVVSGLAGYGHRGAVVADGDNHHRAAIDVASSFRPLDWLGFAVRFSGRYDRHTGTGSGSD